jgi:hypothetical protein
VTATSAPAHISSQTKGGSMQDKTIYISQVILMISKLGLQVLNTLIKVFSNYGDVDTYLISEHFKAAYMVLKT